MAHGSDIHLSAMLIVQEVIEPMQEEYKNNIVRNGF